MKEYTDGRIQRLSDNLKKAHVAPEVVAEIMADGETIVRTSTGVEKADWFRESMQRMNRLLDKDTRQVVREGCACCLGGKRLALAKAIAKEHETLEDRIMAANEARLIFGRSVSMQDDGRVLVGFGAEGEESYRCACLPQATEPLPITYCYCCGGHVKHHLQITLGRQLELTMRSSALSSGGRRPCMFLFRIMDA